MDFPFKRKSESPPVTGQINVKGDILKQMEALGIGGVIHLSEPSTGRQYYVIRLPDAQPSTSGGSR